MTATRSRTLRTTATIAAAAALTAGCFIGPGQTDQGTDIVSLLKIEIPASATNIVGHTESTRVDFLIPNDQWRDYIHTYYPDKQLTQFPPRTEYETPAICIPAYRAGVKLIEWSTGQRIQYRNTDRQVLRGVVVIPNCEPGKTYISWGLSDV